MQLRKASRKKAKIRLGLSAVSGGGKTYSALLIAYGLCKDWDKIAVIDTENGSADLYAHLGAYNVYPLTAPYPPEKYIDAIKDCENSGMEVIIIDSISHEWDGKGGCLEIVESLGGKYQDWGKVTPRHQMFIDSIVRSSCHIITTVRRKQDYEMIKSGDKMKVEKAGLREITREGFEYELTANLELDMKHNASASKDRTGLFMGKPHFVPGIETGEKIKEWCEAGEDVFVIIKNQISSELQECQTHKELVQLYNKYKQDVDRNPELQQLISTRRNEINAKKEDAPPATTSGLEQGVSAEPKNETPPTDEQTDAEILKQWGDALAQCKNMDDLNQLHDVNEQAVENWAPLKQLFTKRRAEFNLESNLDKKKKK